MSNKEQMVISEPINSNTSSNFSETENKSAESSSLDVQKSEITHITESDNLSKSNSGSKSPSPEESQTLEESAISETASELTVEESFEESLDESEIVSKTSVITEPVIIRKENFILREIKYCLRCIKNIFKPMFQMKAVFKPVTNCRIVL